MELKLNVQKKDEKNNALKKKGIIPAVLYGNNLKNQNLQVARNEFEKIYKKAGKSSLINLSINKGDNIPVIVRAIQKNYLKNNEAIHVDFYQVNMNKKIIVDVVFEFFGKSEAIKNGGIFVKNIEKIKVKCLPKNLMSNIQVDLAKLKNFNDKIKVSDLDISKDIEILTDINTLIAGILSPKESKKINTEDEKKDEKDTTEDKKEDEKEDRKGEKKDDKKESKK